MKRWVAIEEEVLDVLRMGPETSAALAAMVQLPDGSAPNPRLVSAAVDRLAARGNVVRSAAVAAEAPDDVVWELTTQPPPR